MISPEWSEVRATSAVPASHRSSLGTSYVFPVSREWPWLRKACSRAIAGTVIGVNPASAIVSSAPAHQFGREQGQAALEGSKSDPDPGRSGSNRPSHLLNQRDMVERLEVEWRHCASVRMTTLLSSFGTTGAPSRECPAA